MDIAQFVTIALLLVRIGDKLEGEQRAWWQWVIFGFGFFFIGA